MSRLNLKQSREGLCRVTEDRQGTGPNGGKSGTRNLETESVRSRAESTGGCVKLKTVTEIRRSSQ